MNIGTIIKLKAGLVCTSNGSKVKLKKDIESFYKVIDLTDFEITVECKETNSTISFSINETHYLISATMKFSNDRFELEPNKGFFEFENYVYYGSLEAFNYLTNVNLTQVDAVTSKRFYIPSVSDLFNNKSIARVLDINYDHNDSFLFYITTETREFGFRNDTRSGNHYVQILKNVKDSEIVNPKVKVGDCIKSKTGVIAVIKTIDDCNISATGNEGNSYGFSVNGNEFTVAASIVKVKDTISYDKNKGFFYLNDNVYYGTEESYKYLANRYDNVVDYNKFVNIPDEFDVIVKSIYHNDNILLECLDTNNDEITIVLGGTDVNKPVKVWDCIKRKNENPIVIHHIDPYGYYQDENGDWMLVKGEYTILASKVEIGDTVDYDSDKGFFSVNNSVFYGNNEAFDFLHDYFKENEKKNTLRGWKGDPITKGKKNKNTTKLTVTSILHIDEHVILDKIREQKEVSYYSIDSNSKVLNEYYERVTSSIKPIIYATKVGDCIRMVGGKIVVIDTMETDNVTVSYIDTDNTRWSFMLDKIDHTIIAHSVKENDTLYNDNDKGLFYVNKTLYYGTKEAFNFLHEHFKETDKLKTIRDYITNIAESRAFQKLRAFSITSKISSINYSENKIKSNVFSDLFNEVRVEYINDNEYYGDILVYGDLIKNTPNITPLKVGDCVIINFVDKNVYTVVTEIDGNIIKTKHDTNSEEYYNFSKNKGKFEVPASIVNVNDTLINDQNKGLFYVNNTLYYGTKEAFDFLLEYFKETDKKNNFTNYKLEKLKTKNSKIITINKIETYLGFATFNKEDYDSIVVTYNNEMVYLVLTDVSKKVFKPLKVDDIIDINDDKGLFCIDDNVYYDTKENYLILSKLEKDIHLDYVNFLPIQRNGMFHFGVAINFKIKSFDFTKFNHTVIVNYTVTRDNSNSRSNWFYGTANTANTGKNEVSHHVPRVNTKDCFVKDSKVETDKKFTRNDNKRFYVTGNDVYYTTPEEMHTFLKESDYCYKNYDGITHILEYLKNNNIKIKEDFVTFDIIDIKIEKEVPVSLNIKHYDSNNMTSQYWVSLEIKNSSSANANLTCNDVIKLSNQDKLQVYLTDLAYNENKPYTVMVGDIRCMTNSLLSDLKDQYNKYGVELDDTNQVKQSSLLCDMFNKSKMHYISRGNYIVKNIIRNHTKNTICYIISELFDDNTISEREIRVSNFENLNIIGKIESEIVNKFVENGND